MKNTLMLTMCSVAMAMSISSCDMDAPTQSTLDETQVFSVYSMAETEVMSIMESYGQQNSFRGRYINWYGLNTDVEVPSGTAPSFAEKEGEKQNLINYNPSATNSQMDAEKNFYADFYTAIERANLAVNGLRKYGNITGNKDMAQLLGEALTLRAVVYNDLIKAFGDVPARFEPNNAANMYKPRTNRDSIYKVLLADLKEAEDYCYWPNENSITKTTERVSKTFVKALRARIALYAGGYGLRGDGYRLSKDPDLAPEKMYEIARQECEDILTSGHNTLGSFKENFTNLCIETTTAGKESIWEIPFADGRGRCLYTWGVRHQSKDQYTQQANGGVNGPIPYLYYDYDPSDVRRDITCVPYEWSKELVNGKSYQQLRKISQWCFGKLRYEWMKRIVTSAQDDGINFQYMRLADVYMMAAEAENQLGNTPKAWTYLKPVLDRALPTAKVNELKDKYCASKEAFQNGIVEQRALEFAGEQLRKADLIRWGIIDEKMAEAKQKLTDLANRTGKYAGLPDKVYYTLDTDGETLKLYGLNMGEDDADRISTLKDEGWESKNWFVSNGVNVLTEDYINGLYVNTPSMNCLWPIWNIFISNSNQCLNNDGNYGQLSN